MKLIELTRAFYPSLGGMEKFVADRLKIYDALGVKYSLISTDYSSGKKDNTLANKQTIFLKQFSPYNITFGLKGYFQKDFDVLSVNLAGRHFSDYGILIASRKNKPIIFTPHFTFHTKRFSIIKKIFIKLFLPILLSRVNKIICFTQVEGSYWLNNFNNVKNKIVVIPHYISKIKFSGNNNYQGKKFLLYLGRIEKNKKYDLLINAFSCTKNKEWELLLTVRKSDLKKNLQRISDNDPRIKFIGTVSEDRKNELLYSCDAVVLPTSFEAFGTVTLEASVFKKPVLCSDLPVLREVLNEEGTIFFNNNVEEIQIALTKFMSLDEKQKRKMGEANFQNSERYSFENALCGYKKLFSELNLI